MFQARDIAFCIIVQETGIFHCTNYIIQHPSRDSSHFTGNTSAYKLASQRAWLSLITPMCMMTTNQHSRIGVFRSGQHIKHANKKLDSVCENLIWTEHDACCLWFTSGSCDPLVFFFEWLLCQLWEPVTFRRTVPWVLLFCSEELCCFSGICEINVNHLGKSNVSCIMVLKVDPKSERLKHLLADSKTFFMNFEQV